MIVMTLVISYSPLTSLPTKKSISLNSSHTPDALSQLSLCEGYALFIPNYRQIVPTPQMHTPPM